MLRESDQTRNRRLKPVVAAVALLVAGGSPLALAQTLEEVVVTARKTEESLQDVPVAVTAFDETALRESGITRAEDLVLMSPSFSADIAQNKVSNSPLQIRGIGTIGTNPGFEGAVGIYIDGIYRSRPGMALQTFNDVGTVEILRGPQGTLFGKNTSAGAVLFTSVAPTFDFHADVDIELGDYDHRRITARINTPLTDDLALRLSVVDWERDGFWDNTQSGDDESNTDQTSVKAQFLWEPNDKWSIRMIADYTESDENCCYGNLDRVSRDVEDDLGLTVLGLRPNFGLPPYEGQYYEGDYEDRNIATNWFTTDETEDMGIAFDVNYEFDNGMLLRSLTSYRDYTNEQNETDSDFGPLDLLTSDSHFDIETFSQEFNLSGSTDSLDYIVGLYYSNETMDRNGRNFSGSDMAVLFAGVPLEVAIGPDQRPPLSEFARNSATLEDEVYAAYAHFTYNLTERWSILGGVRYSEEEKSYEFNNALTNNDHVAYGTYLFENQTPWWASVPGSASPFPEDSRSDEETTYNLGVQWHFNDAAQLYLTYATGFKAGGYSMGDQAGGGQWVPASSEAADLSKPHPVYGASGMFMAVETTREYEPEEVESVELGLKADYLDGRGRVNVAIFDTQFDDMQLSIFQSTPPEFLTVNGNGATSRGLELETSFAFTDRLIGHLAVTNLWEAEFDDDLGHPVANDPVTGFAGYDLPRAPEWAAVLRGSYEFPITDGIDLFTNASLSYTGEQRLELGDIPTSGDGIFEPVEDDYTVLGFTVGVRDSSGTWEASVRCANCTDEEFSSRFVGQPFSGSLAQNHVLGRLAAPRTWVAGFVYRWQ